MFVPKLRFKREDGTSYPHYHKYTVGELTVFHKQGYYTNQKYIEQGIKIARVSDLHNPTIDYSEMPMVNMSEKDYLAYRIENNDFLIARSGSIGRYGIVINLPQNEKVVFGSFLIKFIFDTTKILNLYFGQFYDSDKVIKQLSQITQKGANVNINAENIKTLQITLPCLEEQQKIADFLTAVDEVIAQSEAEVQNLEQQKKVAMQKIFSQEVRFKREDGTDYPEWGNKSFANAFAPLNNNTFSRDMLAENGMVLNIHYGDILVKFGEVCDIQAMDIPKVNAEIDTSKYDELQDGDIILADTAEDETVGKAIEIYHTGTSKVVSGLHTMACRPNDKYAPKYMGYYINSPTYHNQLLPFMQGIKVTSIGRKNIADTVIYYPADLEEQQKIADFLSAYDEAISNAKQELDKWKELKKGLLQQMFV